MLTLTFYGGVNEIGGNKILLEDKDAKIFLDFGMSFGQANKYFSEFLQPRKCNGLGDFIEVGFIPDLKGLYRLARWFVPKLKAYFEIGSRIK